MAVVATGFFDGVHIGHRLVIETLVRSAKERGEKSLILTLWPHPRTVLQDEAERLRLLNSLEEKKRLLYSLGVDEVEVLPFTREFSRMSAFDYLKEVVRDEYGGTAVLLGYDNCLGGDGLTPGQTVLAAEEAGLQVISTDKVSEVGIAVSSTKIRSALSQGMVSEAARLLCYDYSLEGVVVSGNKIGRTLGFPTANMQVYEPMKLIPANGAYFVKVNTLGREFYGMTSIGVRPTVGSGNALTIETNIFDFSEDIYGSDMKISFLERIRDEKKFSSLDELAAQLHEDKDFCRNFLMQGGK